MPTQSPHALMTELLAILKKPVAIFVYTQFSQSYPDKFSTLMEEYLKSNHTAVNAKIENPKVFKQQDSFTKLMDIHAVLHLIDKAWSNLFKDYPAAMLDDVRVLLKNRHAWAHQKALSLQDVQDVAEIAKRLLTTIKIPSAKKAIREIKRLMSLRRDYYLHIPLPEHYIPRVDLLDQLKDESLRSTTVALHGMGGIGKSALVRAFCEEKTVQDRFPDGILWMTFGREVTSLELIQKLVSWIQALNGELNNIDQSNLDAVKNCLAELLKERACLLVLDDVWKKSDFGAFRVGGAKCRTLMTTRDKEIARDVGATILPVSMMNETLAIELLEKWSLEALATTSVIGKQMIVSRLGCLPLAVKLAGAQLQTTTPQIWFQNFDARKLESKRPEDIHDSLELTFALSLDALEPRERKLYTALSIFKEDMVIHERIIVHLWNMLEAFSAENTQELITELASRALCEMSEESTPRTIRLHDLLRDFIRHEIPDSKIMHQALLSAYQKTQTGLGWHTVPDDGYFYASFAYHLQQADALDLLRQALFSYPFLQAKLNASNIISLIMDYEYLDDPAAKLIQRALIISRQILDDEPAQLPARLYAALIHDKHEHLEIGPLLEACYNSPDPMLFPTTQPSREGGALIHILEDGTPGVWQWNVGKEMNAHEQEFLKKHFMQLFVIQRETMPALLEGDSVSEAEMQQAMAKAQAIDKAQLEQELLEDREQMVTVDWRRLKGATFETGWSLGHSGHLAGINSIALSNEFAISASDDWTLKVWNWQADEELRTLNGHRDIVMSVAISGDFAISASDDRTLKVWNWQTGEEVRTFSGHTDAVNSVAILGEFAVSGSSDQTLKVWNWQTGEEVRTFSGHTSGINSVAISGEFAISAAADQVVKVWNWQTGEEIRKFSGAVLSLELSGDIAASGSFDKTLKVWNWQTGEVFQVLLVKEWEYHVGESLPPVKEHPDVVYNIALSNTIAITPSDGHMLKVWNWQTGEHITTFYANAPQDAVAIASDRSIIVSGGRDGKVHFLRPNPALMEILRATQ